MRSGLDERVKRRLRWASVLANGPGALVTLLFTAVLNQGPGSDDIAGFRALNVAVFVPYVPIALIAGLGWAERRHFTPIARWVREQRAATADERDLVLNYPLVPAAAGSALLWGFAALLFGAINAGSSAELSLTIGLTILLGGVTTCAVLYLLVEQAMRPLTVLALESGPPAHPAAPGVSARMTMAWTAATGVPLLGVAALGLANLLGSDLYGEDETTLAGSGLFLAGLGLSIGLLAIVLASRSVARPVGAVRDAMSRMEHGQLDARVVVDDGGEVGQLQTGFNRMAEGLEERERMRDLFGRHVGREVAAAALESEIELGGEEREVAALFVDLVGSTELASERSATEVVAILNYFFRIVVEVTEEHGGLVNKFEGDAALCVFGAPVAHDDPAGHALAAGRKMRNRLRSEVEGLDLGIGVSAGMAVAGNVGAEERFEYTVIGDPINEAARLCELAKHRPERLLASEATLRRAVGDEANRWSLGETITLRGRSAGTRIATVAVADDRAQPR